MKMIALLALTCLSLSAHAQFRNPSTPGQAMGPLFVTISGGNCVVGYSSSSPAPAFAIQSGDGTNPLNSQAQGLAVCRLMAVIPPQPSFTALPGGNWRHSTADIDPATAPCRMEGTVSVAGLTGISCGVDP